MRRRLLRFGLFGVLALVAMLGAVSGGSAAIPVRAGWSGTTVAPASRTLNTGNNAYVYSVSCPTAGGCAVGGDYRDGATSTDQAFVASETNGVWRHAIEVPGSEALNTGGSGWAGAVSCAKPGSCAVAGGYTDRRGRVQAFLVNERHGVWGKAMKVPGLASLNRFNAALDSISCGAPGDCAAGGWYQDNSHTIANDQEAFVVTEKNGVWGKAIEVPGTAALNTGGGAEVVSLSCAAPGNCTAGGLYRSAATSTAQAFVVSEKKGTWGKANKVPGFAALNTGGYGQVTSVSCAAARYCAAGGFYTDGSGHRQAFVVREQAGVWGKAIEVPGTAALNTGGQAEVFSVSCGAAGVCAAGGWYNAGSNHMQAFVVNETNGVWGNAIEVPGTAALNAGVGPTPFADVSSVSCAARGECSAGGSYTDGSGHAQAFVVNESHGVWGDAVEVPATDVLNSGGNATVSSVSCAAAGECAAGGFYVDHSGAQAFVVNETNGVWGDAAEVAG